MIDRLRKLTWKQILLLTIAFLVIGCDRPNTAGPITAQPDGVIEVPEGLVDAPHITDTTHVLCGLHRDGEKDAAVRIGVEVIRVLIRERAIELQPALSGGLDCVLGHMDGAVQAVNAICANQTANDPDVINGLVFYAVHLMVSQNCGFEADGKTRWENLSQSNEMVGKTRWGKVPSGIEMVGHLSK